MTERERTILNEIIRILKKHLAPDKIILFGSRVRKKFPKNSDFDLAVDAKEVDIRLLRAINEEIEEIIGLYKVDIVFLASVDNEFRDIILKTGRVVYERAS